MFVVGLDLATVTGVAIGDSGMNHPSHIKRFSMRFRKPGEPFEMAGKNIELWLEQTFTGPLARFPLPDLIVAEAMLRPAGHKSDDAVGVALSLNQGLFNFCYDHDVMLRKVAVSTARLAFIGQGTKRRGSEDDMKLLVAQHCRDAGYTEFVLPKAKRDQSDAICVWSWGVQTIAKRRPAGVPLLGGVA